MRDHTYTRVVSLAILASFAIVVLAACGYSSTTESPSPSSSPSATAGVMVVPSPTAGSATAAIQTGDLSQFVQVVTAAGLQSRLGQAGPWTVFAPNDDAFSSIPLDQLRADVKQLKAVVAYHIVPDVNIQLADVQDGQTFTTAEGDALTITFDGAARLVDGATILRGYAGGDWTIYVIDQVLSPPTSSPVSSPSP